MYKKTKSRSRYNKTRGFSRSSTQELSPRESELHEHQEEDGEQMSQMLMPTMRHQEGSRYPMKYKVNIDPNVKITQDFLKMPHIIQVRGDFCEEMAEDFAHSFNAAENTGQEIIPIVIDSLGGDIYALNAMIDTIHTSTVPVATIVVGKAMSAGAVLLTCGTPGLRFAAPNSTIMIHSAWESGISGNADEVMIEAEELNRLNKKLLQLISTNCGHDKNYFGSIMSAKKNTNWFINPKEALKHNIVNHIRIPEYSVCVKMTVEFK